MNVHGVGSLALLALICNPSAAGKVIEFCPVQGSSTRKVVDTHWAMSTTDYRASLTRGGQPVDCDPLPPMNADRGVHIEATDRFERVSEKRPTLLVRAYDAATYSRQQNFTNQADVTPKSNDQRILPVQGCTVRFEWGEDTGNYICTELTEPPKLPLQKEGLNLKPDLDLAGLLAGRKHDTDQSWAVDPTMIGILLCPGGDPYPLKPTRTYSGDGDKHASVAFEPGWLCLFGPQLFQDPRGTIAASTIPATDKDGETSIARIHIIVHIRCNSDLSDPVRPFIDSCLPEGKQFEYAHIMQTSIDGEGDIAWNLEKKRCSTLDLRLNVECVETATFSTDGRISEEKFERVELRWNASWRGTLEVKEAVQ